jgi:hypothetical protein
VTIPTIDIHDNISQGSEVQDPTIDIRDNISQGSEMQDAQEHQEYQEYQEQLGLQGHQGPFEPSRRPQPCEEINVNLESLPQPVHGLETTVTPIDFVSGDQINILTSRDQTIGLSPSPDTLNNIGLLFHSTQGAFPFNIPEAFLNFMPTQTYNPVSGFLPVQIDPVEAKCADIRVIIRESINDDDDVLISHITRTNLVHLIEVYSRHYQPNIPIIHGPTFCLVYESPVLLLAMMLVGACYSPENTISTPIVNKLAIILLNWIDNQSVRYSH